MPTSSSAKLPTELDGASPEHREGLARPDLLAQARKKLGRTERWCLRLVRASFERGLLSAVLPWLQRSVGQAWIYHATKHLCRVHGLERVPLLARSQGYGAQAEKRAKSEPAFAPETPTGTPFGRPSDSSDRPGSVLVVANHRSFFDMYVITARLVRGGLKQRIVFPVRSNFFFDSWLGLLVNFLMSFLAMYPPLFRDRKKAALNLLALDELAWLLARGGVFAGLHPEGTRKRDDDPYTFLPAQPGVGRVIYKAQVPVVPVFINGLKNDLWQQVSSNFTRQGTPIFVVYGQPIDFSDLLVQPPSPKLYRQIAERCMEAIGQAGQEERQLRTELDASMAAATSPPS